MMSVGNSFSLPGNVGLRDDQKVIAYGAYLSAERLIRSKYVSDSKIMRFLTVTMICLGGLVLTLILTEVLGYFLFSSGFLGSDYDSAFPLAIVFSFVISLVCVVTLFRRLLKQKNGTPRSN